MNAAVVQSESHAVELQSLRVRYNDTEVLRGVGFFVQPGEIVSLLGPSGCGKTTTLRSIAGFVTPDSGEVLLDGRDVTEAPVHRRGIGMVFQSYALFPHLSVFDNVAYGLRMRKVPREEMERRVTEALALVKLEEFAHRRPKQLSGGQQQRVAMARALVIRPKVLLLDEPLSNLDAKLRQEMQVELRRLLKATGAASVFVTHDQQEAMVLSDRIILMNAGEIVQEGTPEEIYREPRNLFAAAFVGQANFLYGRVVAVLEDGLVRINAGGNLLEGVGCGELSSGDSAVMVVKHECVSPVCEEKPRLNANVLDCVFEMANFTGASVQLHCTAAGQPFVCLTNAAQHCGPIAAGADLRVQWERSDSLVFPATQH